MTSPSVWAVVAGVAAAIAVLASSREFRRLAVTLFVLGRRAAEWLRRRFGGGERDVGPQVVRRAFEDLGPTYIKLGQIVASSNGLFPERYVVEFQRCLDRVRPFAWQEVERIVADELGAPIPSSFASFERAPLASASIAQVHAARLPDGDDVVAKVQRPGIAERIDADLGMLRAGARVLAALPTADLANPVGIIRDFDTTIREELDFRREARNMDEFNRMMRELGHRDIVAPRVVWPLTTSRVLVMERLHGVRVDDVEGVRARNVDAEERLVLGLRAWFQCMLIYGFFHGDVHAGNLMLLDDGRLGFLDFGIIGRFNERQRRLVTDYIVSFVTADYRRLGEVMIEMGSVGADIDLEKLAADMRDAYSPLLGMAFGELKYSEVVPGILRAGIRNRIKLPNEFVLVTKQMLFFDRYAKLLAPKLNIFTDPRLVVGLAEDVARARARVVPEEKENVA